MKFLKKAISLVLVFAMLASFAGMTGYSPASIVAEAADRKTYTLEGGYSITVAETWYKTTFAQSGYHPIWLSSQNMPDDYYGIPYGHPLNNMDITFNVPENATWSFYQFLTDRETSGVPNLSGGGNSWGAGGTGAMGAFTGKTEVLRGESTFERDELGSLFKNNLNNAESQGFRDIDMIYLVFIYEVNGVKKYAYIDVKVEFAPSTPANNTSTAKPADSKAGLDAAKVSIDVPPVMYKDGNGNFIGSISSSSGTTTLDTTIDITLPTVKSATLRVVSYNSDATVHHTFNLASGANSCSFAGKSASTFTEGNAYMILRLDYTVSVPNTPYNSPSGNVLDTTYSEANSIGKNLYLDGTYNSDGSKSAPDTVDVTYTQYMAVYVATLPRYYQVGWQTDAATKYSGAEQSLAGVIMLDMAPALATDGINLYGSLRSGESGDYSNAALRENWLESRGSLGLSQTQNNALIWYNAEQKTSCGNDSGVYTSGQFSSSGANSSNRTLGGTIYYDSTTTSAVNINMKYDFTSSNYTCDDNGLDGFWLTWYNGGQRLGWDVTQDGVAGTYLGDGISSHSNSNAADANGLNAYGNVVTKTDGTYPNSGMNFQTSDTTVYFSFNLANATAAGTPYWRCVQQINRPYYSTWGMSTNLRCIWGFHLDAIAVDRETEHKVINEAISKNFVEAEMDPTWWKNYRDEVCFAYFDCGDLKNEHGVKGLFDGLMADGKATDAPVYKTANIADLEAAILRAPNYDRGTSQRDTNLYPLGVATPGAGFEAIIDYADGGAQSADPAVPNATYYNNDTAGNGINNIDNAAFYRYSGTYFYTEETWRPYATERYYALNIQKYRSANLDVFWYGAGYIKGGSGTFCYTYLQSHINAATDRLNAAYNNLELKTLAGLKMRNDKNPSKDYDDDGVVDNVTAGNGAWVYDSNNQQVIGYDAIMAHLASLIPTDTFSYYTDVETNSAGFAQSLKKVATPQLVYDTTALEALLSQMQTRFNADQTVVDMGIEFELYIENFLALVELTKRNPVPADTSVWGKIFNYINNTLCGDLKPEGGLTNVNFVTEISRIYELTQAQKDNFQGLIDAYTTAIAANKTAVGQDAINTAVNNFFNALKEAFSSVWVTDAAAQALDVVSNPATFEVYTPNFASNDKTNSIYLPSSVNTLRSWVAQATAANSYVFKDTTWKSLEDRQAEIIGWAKMKEEGGLLEKNKVVLTALERAITNAEAAIAEDNVTTTITSHTGATVEWGKYTAQSVAELRFVINQAMNVDDTMDYTKQLQVDKLTFAIYDEWDDAKGLLLTSDTGMAPRTWSYDGDGNPTGYTDNWGDPIMKGFLYGDRVEEGNGTDEGLKPNAAYYGFLEEEIKGNTIVKFDDAGNVKEVDETYIGTVWTANGDLILNDNGTPVGDRIFKNWSSYMEHYNEAVALVNAKDKTVDQQGDIYSAAKKLYDARNALELMNLYFPNNTEDYETAKGWYNELSAYVQKTDVTRYGWEYAEVTNEVTDEETGEVTTVTTTVFQKSADPLSSVEQSVYIYNGVTAEVEAQIETFRAKYASDSSTEEYDSLEAAQNLYNSIKAALTDPATSAIYTVKKTDDDSLTAGFNDLVENYIAGTWTVTFDEETGASTGTYATDLLNDTQAGLLQTYLTNAQSKINSKTDATAGFGTTLGGLTSIVFDETQKPATDLQFAAAMKQQMVEFFGMKFTANVPDYYNNATPIELYVFDQLNANKLLNENVNPFYINDENWPCIYEINNLQVEQGPEKIGNKANPNYGVYEVTVWPSGATASTGTGADQKIEAIFAKIGAKSSYYADVIAQTNKYHTGALAWIVENTIVDGVTIPGDSGTANVILADLNASENGSKITVKDQVLTDINNAGKPIEQWADVKVEINYIPAWYADGYGCYTDKDGRVYYLYQGSKEIPGSSFGSWFKNRAPSDTKTTDYTKCAAATLGVVGLDSVIKDDGKNYYGGDLEKRFTHTDYNQITNIATNTPGSGKASKYYADLIVSGGWTLSNADDLRAEIQEDQDAIDKSAALIYQKIQGLELLPATEAYRDVYNTYLSVMGKQVTDGNWNGDSYSSYVKADDVDFTFYNVSQASKIEGMYSKLDNNAVPPYGIVSRNEYGSFLGKYTQTGEYTNNPTNNPWYNMEQFINSLIGNGATITIDQAEKVNTYNKSDNITSIKETLIDDYLSKLEFDDLVYDRLDAVVKAFLGDNLSEGLEEIEGTLQGMGFTVGGNYNGEFFKLEDYTDKSLLEVAGILRSQNVLAAGKIIEQVIGENAYQWVGDTFPLPIEFDNSYKGTFYTTTTDQNMIDGQTDNSVLKAFLNALNTKLVLKGVNLDGLLKEIARGDAIVPEKYDRTHTAWGVYVEALADAKDLRDNADSYDIRFQESVIDAMQTRLAAAINALEEAILADSYAPSMTLKTSVGDVKSFYSNEAYEVALRKADVASYTVTGEGDNTTYTPNPAAGTFFVPNSSGYSLIVYTNELNPRIVINLEDLEQNLAGAGSTAVWQEAAKKEYISINAKRTSGVATNVIAGTIAPADNGNTKIMSVLGQTDNEPGIFEATSTNTVTVENTTGGKGSSAFAILAPTFVSDKATQAAVYTIEARDGSERTVNGGTVFGNAVNQFDFGGIGQEPVDIEVLDTNNRIAIYVYYYSLKAADGKDEGINADGTALATPAITGTNVPNALLSGEPGFKGTDWRNGILLQRHFSDSHRVWEYVSEIKKNKDEQYNVNGTQVPVYNDPTFGYLNTGSFYYVLDEKVAADAEVIAAYDSNNNAVAGCMDYDRATAAKTAMIDAINAMDETDLKKMKESGRFYNYGDYETNEYGEVLYNGEEPKWINWAQSLNNKVENGDLVFVHVVDRWGNVVNRIVEITNLDKIGPAVNSAAAGAVTIAENGGSGLTDIQVHNGDFSLGEFEYQISQSQNVELKNGEIENKAEVNCAGNELTIVNLVPGKTYYIGAEDKAGNRATTPVKANADGHIVITIDNQLIQTGEDMGLEGNSSMFTLNGTDTIILNSGETSSVINADVEGNVFANRLIKHLITTVDTVTGLKTVYQDGTVEEWTSANARVQNNGDGTLTWTIGRNFAEGEHSYKVYAKVGDTYETFYAPANIFATTKSVRITYRVAGPGNTVLIYGGSGEIKNSNYNSLTVPYGSKVTITADTNVAGCEFYYWTNNTTDRIISTANVLEFKAVSNVDYVAQFTNNSTYLEGKKFVVYVNNAKNIIERFELADGENYKVPTGPVLPDYTFKGWSMTKDEVLESDKKTIIVEPIYELNATNTVTITEGNYTATGAGTYTAEDNQRAVVTISTSAKNSNGKEFLYWIDADTDEIVSYARTYTFFCVKDTELTPIYGDASTVKAEPIVRITEVKFNALSGKVSFFAERSVPEEYMILQTGIVVTKTEAIGTNEDVFVVGGTSTAAGTSTSTANNGFYSANATVATGQTVWARAYAIYETADGEIFEAYGPVVSYTVD